MLWGDKMIVSGVGIGLALFGFQGIGIRGDLLK